MTGEVALTSTKGQASDTNPIQATSDNIEALGDKVPIDICPGQPCPNVDSHRVFMNDNIPESGHGYVYAYC
jgi:hypothetical protein